jgi:chemotaxis methyl-accepting protein methylase
VDYDEDKIRVVRQTALQHPRIRFEQHNLLDWEYPACDTILLLDVLHYWKPPKQQAILNQACRALRPGGVLILREAARAESEEHKRVDFWERIATRIGHNKTEEGLHFQTLAELEGQLRTAGFKEIKREAAGDSNVLLIARV